MEAMRRERITEKEEKEEESNENEEKAEGCLSERFKGLTDPSVAPEFD
jgi:hypothetical protein